MSTIGSNLSNFNGGNLPPPPEQNAWTEMNQAALGFGNTIDRPFTQLSPLYEKSYLSGDSYKSTSSHPNLQSPLENVRMLQSFNSLVNKDWQANYDKLVNMLPQLIQKKLIAQESIPFEQRNPNYTALNNTLVTTAKFLYQATNLAQQSMSDELDHSRTELNNLFPAITLQNTLTSSQEVMETIHLLVAQLGPNDRNYDALMALQKEINSSRSILEKLKENLIVLNGGVIPAEITEKANQVVEKLKKTQQHLAQMVVGDTFQILDQIIAGLKMAASAYSLPLSVSAPFYLGLKSAMQGISSEESASGLIGSHLTHLVATLSDGIVDTAVPHVNHAAKELFNMMLTAGLGTAIALGSQLAQTNEINSPLSFMPENVFSAELMTHLIIHSNLSVTYFQEAVALMGANEKIQNQIAQPLAQIAHLFMVETMMQKFKQKSEGIIESLATQLNQSLQSMQSLVHEEKRQDALSESAHKQQALQIALKQATLALDSQHYDQFIPVFKTLLDNIGISTPHLLDEISRLGTQIATIVKMTPLQNDQPLTGIIAIG